MATNRIKRIVKAIPGLREVAFRTQSSLWKWREGRFRRYCHNLSKFVPEPFFVKIGANDGVTGDPCSDLLLSDGWKGLLVEPVPYCFDRLKTNYGDAQRFRLEQVAIGGAAGETTFYYVAPEAAQQLPDLPEWFDQLGSFDKDHIVKHLGAKMTPFIVESKVEVRPLSEILRRNHVKEIHLLHIDTEGYDYEVLKTLDFGEHAPFYIFIEHKHLSPESKRDMLGLLRRHGYSACSCGDDYFAVNRDAHRTVH